MTKTILGAGVLALAVASSPFAFGHAAGGDRGCGHDMLVGGGRILHTLDLSDDQKQKVKDILTAHRPKLRQLVANEKAADQTLADKLFGTGVVTQQDLDALLQRESQARNELTRERLAAALEVRDVLTSAQIRKAAAIRTGMKQLHAEMRQLLGDQGRD